MNKEEKLPEGFRIFAPNYHLYFYFTGQKPHEIGYMLVEDKKILKKVVMGVLTEEGMMDRIWIDVETYLKDKELTMKVIREVKWVNPHFFNL